jgi:hypothetical protein
MLKIVNVSGGYSVASETTQPRRVENTINLQGEKKTKKHHPRKHSDYRLRC